MSTQESEQRNCAIITLYLKHFWCDTCEPASETTCTASAWLYHYEDRHRHSTTWLQHHSRAQDRQCLTHQTCTHALNIDDVWHVKHALTHSLTHSLTSSTSTTSDTSNMHSLTHSLTHVLNIDDVWHVKHALTHSLTHVLNIFVFCTVRHDVFAACVFCDCYVSLQFYD